MSDFYLNLIISLTSPILESELSPQVQSLRLLQSCILKILQDFLHEFPYQEQSVLLLQSEMLSIEHSF